MPPSHVVLAFWRIDPEGIVEFFTPLDGDYLSLMRYLVTDGSAARTARRLTSRDFGLNPRANARVFHCDDTCVVAFNLSPAEAQAISPPGAWLPTTLMVNPSVAMLLQEVATRI